MNKSLLLFFAALLASVSFSDCVANVDVSIDVTIREHPYGNTGYVPLTTKTLDSEDRLDVYNYTKLYFYGYYSEGVCRSNCNSNPVNNFSAYIMLVTASEGTYKYTKLENLSKGFESDIYQAEGNNISFEISNFQIYGSCTKEYPEDTGYCVDYTEAGHCSTAPPYKCKKVSPEDYSNLDLVKSDSCDRQIWGSIMNCVDGFTKNICKGQDVYTATCKNDAWKYELLENCSEKGLFCGVTGTGPSCMAYEESGFYGCSDGTPVNACSSTKPKICTDQLTFIDNVRACGCPSYAVYDGLTETCKYLSCSDGTELNKCSQSKPYFCYENGSLVERASVCGCLEQQEAVGDNCVVKEESQPVIDQTPVEELEPQENVTPQAAEEPAPKVAPAAEATPDKTTEEPSAEEEGPVKKEGQLPMDAIYLVVIAVLAGAVVYLYFNKK